MTTIPRPKGHHILTPSAVVKEPARVIDFVEKAFAGKLVERYDGPDGVIYHAELLLGDSALMLGTACQESEAMPASLSLYVDDAGAVDATYKRALDAGAVSMSEPQTQPWGYRSACVSDTGGNRWTICAIVEELSHAEIALRMQGS